MSGNLEILKTWVQEAKRIVFFGGAGVSTESGIPDFRGVDGLYRQKYRWPPEEILSSGFFLRNTSEFYRFYRDKMLIEGAQPNPAHRKLSQWEREGKLLAVVAKENAEKVLEAMRATEEGKDAAVIGHVTDQYPGKLVMATAFGGKRVLQKLTGAQLPRIC